MKIDLRWFLVLALVAIVSCGGGPAEEEPVAAIEEAEATHDAPTVDPVIVQIQADCAAAADAMAARQAEASLYDRLGGREAIFAVTTDVVRRHRENPTIAHLMEGVDDADLIENVTNFLSRAAGGDVAYDGLDMVAAHAHLGMTDEHFLSAGGDMQAAMQAAGVAAPEIEEVMCMFASLHGDVVRG